MKLPTAGMKIQSTLAPGTGLLLPSRTRTANVSRVVLTTTVWLSPCTTTIDAGAAGTAVAVKVTVLQAQRSVAEMLSVPGSLPRVYPTDASPAPLVKTVSAASVPVPAVRWKRTPVPATELPKVSVACTMNGSGSAVRVVSVWPLPELMARVVAAPFRAVAVKVAAAPPAWARTESIPEVVPRV